MPQLTRTTTGLTNITTQTTRTHPRVLTKQRRIQSSSELRGTQGSDVGIISTARKLRRVVARLARLEETPPDQGIDYSTFHALYRPFDEQESSGGSFPEGATSSTNSFSSPLYYSHSREESFETISSSRLRYDSSTDSLSSPTSPTFSTRTQQRRATFAKLTRHLGENIPPELVSLDPGVPRTPSPPPTPQTPQSKRRLIPFSRSMPFAPPVEYRVPDSPGPCDTNEFTESPCGQKEAAQPKRGLSLPPLLKARPRPRKIEIVVTLHSESTECFSEMVENVPPPPSVNVLPSGSGVHKPDDVDGDVGNRVNNKRLLRDRRLDKMTRLFGDTPPLELVNATETEIEATTTSRYTPDRILTSSPTYSMNSQPSTPSVYYSDIGDGRYESGDLSASVPTTPSPVCFNTGFNIGDSASADIGDHSPYILMAEDPSSREYWRRTEKLSKFFGVDLNRMGDSYPPLPIGEAF